jgi:hypothetical protein
MIEKREDQRENSKGSLGGAPYLAKIIGHADLLFQGGLEVVLIRDSGNQVGNESQTYLVKYASPFYGCTPYEFTGQNITADDAQTSYGFWGVPPDTGVTGIVMFIDGKPDQGFWIASVQDKFQNHMIPAIGGTTNYKTDQDYEQGEHPLPVVEHNRKANEGDKNLEIDKIPRAVHPIADRFKTQGLTRDEFRGTSTSTARRDVPNMVFGMSSPGPLNRDGKKKFLGNRESPTPMPVPVQRLGGTQFVMDDGDDRYYREDKPSEGPPNYLNFTPFQLGDKDIPYNEHFRIRTRTGHQLLFHNSEDLIYIANSKGTAWIEFTSDGKIDIYAEDSISIRTKQDFNFFCDRDFNLEVGRNFNTKVHGEMHTNVIKDQVLVVDRDQKIHIKRRKDETVDEQYRQTVNDDVKKYYAKDYTHNVDGRMDFKVAKGFSFGGGGGASGATFAPADATSQDPADPVSNDAAASSPVADVSGATPDRIDIKIYKDMRIEHIGVSLDHTVDGYIKTKVKGDVDIHTDGTYKHYTAGNVDIKTAGHLFQQSTGDFEVKSGGHIYNTSDGTNETNAGENIIETATLIHMNGPTASSAGGASTAEIAALPEEARTSAKSSIPLNSKTHSLPGPDGEAFTESIMRRVPTHEPWPHHENLDPQKFKPEQTDKDVDGRYSENSDSIASPAEYWKKYNKPKDNPF